MKTRFSFLGKRALEAAILWYRARISGRGPLRRVTCTFGRCESCSAYGLRMVQHHARSLPHALRLIFGRIQRCRSASVYRSGHALVWGQDYDRLDQVDADARRVHERPITRGALLRAAIGLARYRGERKVLPALLARLRALPRSAAAAAVPLRDGRRLHEHLRGRWLRQICVPLMLSVLLPLIPMPIVLVITGFIAAQIGASTWRFLSERQRLDRQLRQAHFALA